MAPGNRHVPGCAPSGERRVLPRDLGVCVRERAGGELSHEPPSSARPPTRPAPRAPGGQQGAIAGPAGSATLAPRAAALFAFESPELGEGKGGEGSLGGTLDPVLGKRDPLFLGGRRAGVPP